MGEQLIMNYKYYTVTYISCFLTYLSTDWFVQIDLMGKLLLLILGIISGVLIISVKLCEYRKAKLDLEMAKHEQIDHENYHRNIEEYNRLHQDDDLEALRKHEIDVYERSIYKKPRQFSDN